MTPYVLTLTGPSMSGKSIVIQTLRNLSQRGEFKDFKPVAFQKYTTREFRDDEISLINSGRENELDQKPVIGTKNLDNKIAPEHLHDAKIAAFQKLKCDLAYEQYGDRYGLRLEDLYTHLKKGETPVVILNDVRTVEDIRVKLGRQCFSLFIFREVPNYVHFQKIGKIRGYNNEKIKIRFQKAETIYRIYIENIHLFDKLLLNIKTDKLIDGGVKKYESLEKLLEQLVRHICMVMPSFYEKGRGVDYA